MPSQISRHHKKPVLRAFSVYTFHVFFKKSISITPTKRANRSSHCQFVCSMVRPFHSFHSLRYFAALPFIRVCLSLTRQSPLHSLGTSCHARFACTHSLHHSTHSFRYFIRSLIPLISRPPPFHILPHMSSFLVAISTIRVASQWDK